LPCKDASQAFQRLQEPQAVADPLDLTDDALAAAIDNALERGRPISLAYVGDDGQPKLSARGSTHVHGPMQLAIWTRSRDSGLVTNLPVRPKVSLLYLGAPDLPSPWVVNVTGTARIDESANDTVYEMIPQGERDQDPERKGVAVIVDVERVTGFGADGPFELAG
jgi:hypothetical protein